MKNYISLLRVKHWIKNLLIFVPMLFARVINQGNLYKCIIAFLSFSFLCSFVYIINDIRDIEKDKNHPRKKNRPLPSGKIKKCTAIIISIILLIITFILNICVCEKFFCLSTYLILIYLSLNIGYSFGLKNIPIIDIGILSAGFILRVFYGASIIGVPVSNWLFLTIMSASLFLGLGKRKKEFEKNKDTREVLKKYNPEFLDKFQYLSLTLTIVFYSLWTIEINRSFLVYSVPLLMILFMRYSLIMETGDEGDPITLLYNDAFMIILCFVYALLMLILMII